MGEQALTMAIAGLHCHLNANCLLIPAPNHAPLVAQRGGWQQETI